MNRVVHMRSEIPFCSLPHSPEHIALPKTPASISSSSNDKRHDGKHHEQQVIGCCSRHWVSRGEILLDSETANPEHEPELRDEHED